MRRIQGRGRGVHPRARAGDGCAKNSLQRGLSGHHAHADAAAAVCGIPWAAPQELITELKDDSRDFYTGLVGWTGRPTD
ncbi:hypothetical protein CP975_34325 [Streptomyces alboniger]|uniref:Uncharacterized protein n=1 Tax=Streptomyces alboniger TaxID=132473 RepID=A0A5J6HWM0_STRAD|nr:hypothetical protein CP975_34325 [Streptomyces alboniger]